MYTLQWTVTVCGLPPSAVAVDCAAMCFVYSCGPTTGGRCPCVGLHYSGRAAGEVSLAIVQVCFNTMFTTHPPIHPSIHVPYPPCLSSELQGSWSLFLLPQPQLDINPQVKSEAISLSSHGRSVKRTASESDQAFKQGFPAPRDDFQMSPLGVAIAFSPC